MLLAAPHHGLAEGIRSLLETAFDAVIMVADMRSLCESAQRLEPRLAIVDMALAGGDVHGMTAQLRCCCPGLKLILLAVYDDPSVVRLAMEAGAEGMVAKSRIATDLLTAVDAVLRGESHFPGKRTH
ncbi:MAG TPA: response regulator [Vicinamibacteria bacterium]|nr:response regulator [Vicinamibacteria bacterium]